MISRFACCVILYSLFSLSALSQKEDKGWKEAAGFLHSQTYAITEGRDLRLLGREIKKRFPDTLTRLKASYLWVINHIRYDCEGLKNKNSRWALDSVLLYRKAVCAGYVNVFRNLCEASGVECIDINGFGRSGLEDLLLPIDSFLTNHTWNAVKVDGQWRLIDITWASGYTNEDCSSFTPHRNDWYFCADPVRFAWDHYPQDSSWQLLPQPISWNEFYRYPLLYQGIWENNMNDFYPRSVLIQKKVGDTIRFHFKSGKDFNRIIFSSRKEKQLYRMETPEKTADGYRFVYTIEKQGAYDLQVDLLQMENNRPATSQEITSFTDIVYWIEAMPAKQNLKARKNVF